MSISVQCDECFESYRLKEELAGKVVKCKSCGGKIAVPKARSASSAATKPAAPTKKTPAARPASSKSTAGLSATPKKSAPKPKPKEETFEEDFGASFDDSESFGEEETYQAPRRRSASASGKASGTAKKKKKKSKSSGDGWMASVIGMFQNDVGLCLVAAYLLGYCVYAGMILMSPLSMAPIVLLVTLGGLLVLVVGSLWMLVVSWKVSPGWAGFFMGTGVIGRMLDKQADETIAIGFEVVRTLIFLYFIVTNWEDVKAAAITWLVGVTLTLSPLFLLGAGIADDLDDINAPGMEMEDGEFPAEQAPAGQQPLGQPPMGQMQMPMGQPPMTQPNLGVPPNAQPPAAGQPPATGQPTSAPQTRFETPLECGLRMLPV